MRSAYSVMERAISVDLHGIVDVLVDGYVSSEASIKLLDLLLWIYTKGSMIELCLSTFGKMVHNGFSPDVKNCNRILRVLRDRNLVTKGREFYEAMGEFGIGPTIVTYNTLLDSFCKEGEVQEALDLLLQMQERGCAPNDVTYNVLINGLSKKGELEQAKGLIEEMLNLGLMVSAFTYNPLICGYCKKGELVEALDIGCEMELRGAYPIVATYNTLMNGLCKRGSMVEARQQFFNMLKKNLEPDIVSYNTLIYGYYLKDLFCDKKLGYFEYAKETTVEANNACLSVEATVNKINSFLEDAFRSSCEGIMMKSLDVNAGYAPSKRTDTWLKVQSIPYGMLQSRFGGIPKRMPCHVWILGFFLCRVKHVFKLIPNVIDRSYTVQKFGRNLELWGLLSNTELQMKEFFSGEKILSKKPLYYQTAEVPDIWFSPELVWEIRGADFTISPVHQAAIGLVHPSRGISIRFPRFIRSVSDRRPEECSTAADIADMFHSQTRKMQVSTED
ncbi:hypothetical protein HHK36_020207 [Tetracentron sinense]|uniref:ATP-dependent DNA ligase family profile domain-containing protein n=1 Tax=Tetracentron sinense TaxID=13715 RepID=A0A834YV15_TETSI|nr:hypothetical protein HHK36_020207 [Tetracentron sinense]